MVNYGGFAKKKPGMIYYWYDLVGGWATYPSEKWWSESQLGLWHSQYMEK